MGYPRSRSGFTLPDRPLEGRVLAGVCAGWADTWRLDPTLLRLTLLLLCFAWGLGVVFYVVSWLLMPERGTSPASIGDAARHNLARAREELSMSAERLSAAWSRTGGSWPRPLGRRWIAFGLILGGALLVLGSFGAFAWLTPLRALAFAAIALGAAALVGLRRG